jgi:hypothetical protein
LQSSFVFLAELSAQPPGQNCIVVEWFVHDVEQLGLVIIIRWLGFTLSVYWCFGLPHFIGGVGILDRWYFGLPHFVGLEFSKKVDSDF